MATQTVQITAPAGLAGTLLLKLFTENTDTLIGSEAATPGTNDPSLYSAAFVGTTAARVRAVLFNDSTPVATDHVTLVNATATYQVEGLKDRPSDVLTVDTFAELSGPPAATSTLKDKLTWLFMWMRNKSTETATERKLYADDTTTVISTSAVSDDGTTFTKGEEA